MSGYSSDDALLDAVSENEGDKDEDEGEDEDEDEPEDPMKNYLHRNMYEGLREKIRKYTLNKLYRAKKQALEQIDGSYGDSYSKLPHYAEMRIFVGLDALRKGFLQGCSPFLGFDGCHLKGPYGGVLLAAIGLDGNNGLFPLAFAVVESECKDSWCFFFQALDEMLGGFAVDRPWTFMSDRQKALLECINDMVPHAINRRYAFPVDLKNDHITNNIAESFNAWIGEFRGKPIMTLLEGVRTKVMNMVHKRHVKGLKWTKEIMPNILKKANEQMEWSRHCNLHVASQTEFEVLDKNRDNIEVYIDISFSKEKYMMAYTHVIHPIPDVKFWKNLDDVQPSTILPPPLRRLPGRPRKSRRKETGDQSNVKPGIAMRCTICHEIGHNKRTCQRTAVGASQRNKSKKNIRRNKRNAQAIAEEMPYIPQPPPSQPGTQTGLDDIRADLADTVD
ncbi:UNVERIFIED_CONTAM: hypothetical protein Sangu_1570200 [Sesamum angustifolium]|uniref:MULE transposase domain-containing protein n=1 Tax=Sesamum angustifolium TaxID=2727405 RepID=A0AAW2MR63_9LAMI